MSEKQDLNITKKAGLSLTDSEKSDHIETRVKKIETMEAVRIAFVLLAFIGIINFAVLKTKIFKK